MSTDEKVRRQLAYEEAQRRLAAPKAARPTTQPTPAPAVLRKAPGRPLMTKGDRLEQIDPLIQKIHALIGEDCWSERGDDALAKMLAAARRYRAGVIGARR